MQLVNDDRWETEAPPPAAEVDFSIHVSTRVERWLQAAVVPSALVVACLAAWVQHRWIVGAPSAPLAVFVLPALLGVSAGAVIAWLLVARRSAEALATIDQLTRLKNRAAMNSSLGSEIERSERYGGAFGLVVFDVDHFKGINDNYGHATGDVVLLHIAETINRVIRRTDVFGRWGGDEFVLIAPGTGAAGCRALAEKIRMAVERTPAPGGMVATISVGVAGFVRGDSGASLLARADEALYEAKRGGRNRSAATRCLRSTGTFNEV